MPRRRILDTRPHSGRELRVGEFIRKELTELIRTRMRDPRINPLNISVNDVRVTRDLSFADIYLTSMNCESAGEQQQLVQIFENASGFLRSEVAARHSMRTTPRLRFHYDELVETGARMEALIDEVMKREVLDGE